MAALPLARSRIPPATQANQDINFHSCFLMTQLSVTRNPHYNV